MDSDFVANFKPLFINEPISTVVNLYTFQCLTKLKLNLSQLYRPTNFDVHDYSIRYNYKIVVHNFRVNKV